MEIYLDNSATTKPSEAVVASILDSMQHRWHNPSALYRPAMEVDRLIDEARETCLRAVNASGHRLIFTSGGTEADNIAILGYLRRIRKPGRVLMSSVEHPAVSACAQEVARLGHECLQIPVTRTGVIDLDALESMLDERVLLICVMQVNNESGAIQPIERIVSLRNRKCPEAAIHVDGVQGYLRVPLDFSRSGIQSYAFSGHKIHCCKGIGGLIVHRQHKLSPIVFGGGQEDGERSGTENVPGILALAAAVATFPRDAAPQMMRVKRTLYQKLIEAVPQAVLNGPALDDPACAPHILNISFPPVRSQTMLFALEGDGIYVSAGSACASKKQKVSGILTAMGIANQLADCALRFSLCPDVTEEQAAIVADAVRRHYALLSKYVRR